ncbi:hypothetical protein QBK99_25180 [Corticibacterium sp. UT-5YL-CI-8]|nr:hypothetical protein [Tianweitania sp. UT-5YL-CI-8]
MKYIRNAALSLLLAALPVAAEATDFTAGKVLNEMSADERAAYISGVVEGLAYARYKKDGDETGGMKCIYDWLYYEDTTPQDILSAFKRFPDHTPGAVMAAMVEKECGS